jgi:hypothetical protein
LYVQCPIHWLKADAYGYNNSNDAITTTISQTTEQPNNNNNNNDNNGATTRTKKVWHRLIVAWLNAVFNRHCQW